MSWINDVLSELEHVETPRSWLWWSLCSAVSATAGNNYYLSVLKGAVIVKPNLYVILLGESGLGKEFPVSLAIDLVDKADVTRVIAGASSIQAIVKELSITRTRPDKEPIMDSRAFIVNGELSTAIIQDPQALTTLTDLYDRKTKWAKLLKGDGEEKLKDPYITALFGSSPAHFYDSIPQVNIEGGYIGRNLIVYEEKRAKDTDLFSDDESSVSFPYPKYITHLEKIGKQHGRMVVDLNAKELFNRWRKEWRAGITQPDKTGFVNRVPVHVLKVAMCLCLADYTGVNSHIITVPMIEEAIANVSVLVYTNRKAAEGRGIDPLAQPIRMVLDFLVQSPTHTLLRKQLLTKGYGSYDGPVLDKALEYLDEVGWIKKTRLIRGTATDWEIELAGEQLAAYTEFLNRGKK